MHRQFFAPLFAASNLWLLVALALFVGKKQSQSEPTMYSFAGIGEIFNSSSYEAMVHGSVVLALFFLFMAVRSIWRANITE